VNRVYVRKTSLAIPNDSGVTCNTTSRFAGSRHYVSDWSLYQLTGNMGCGGGEGACVGL
jgi:hypothetical protein